MNMENKFNPEDIKLIFGLGNPGPTYKNTYHNLGLLAIEHLNKALDNDSSFKTATNKKFSYVRTKKLIVARPNGFMNEAGPSVKPALQYFNIKTNALMIIHDDSDIFIGKYKISFGRGAAGHKGIQSIINTLNTQNFWRCRIGIRKDIESRERSEKFVLKTISLEHQKIFKDIFEIINQHFT